MPYVQMFIHCVWSTYRLQPLIEPVFENRLHAFLRDKCESFGLEALAINGMHDHVHIVSSFRPSMTASEFVRILKGSSSHFVTHRLNFAFQWQAEYSVFSVSRANLSAMIAYVDNQKAHHADATIIPFHEFTPED